MLGVGGADTDPAAFFQAIQIAHQLSNQGGDARAAALAAAFDAALAALAPPLEALSAGDTQARDQLHVAAAELARVDAAIRAAYGDSPDALAAYTPAVDALAAALSAALAPGADLPRAAADALAVLNELRPPQPSAPPPEQAAPPLRDAGEPVLAALADASIESPAPAPADLQPTPDVQITQEIEDLADQLDRSPARIFAYVRNQIAFEPYYGSLKGSTATLWSGAGNAYDQASLLIALLRASGIHARYVGGVVTVPTEPARAWLGVDDLDAAVRLLRTSGIAAAKVPGGLRLDHAWVIAYLDLPEVGGKAWLPLDPSFKLRAFQGGIALPATLSFDRDAFLSQLRTDLPHEAFGDQVRAYLAQNQPGAGLGDLPAWGAILPEEFAQVPVSLPYQIDGVAAEYPALPTSLRHQVIISAQTLGSSPVTLVPQTTLAIPEIALSRLTLSFVPVGSQVEPRLQTDDETIAVGTLTSSALSGEIAIAVVVAGGGQAVALKQTIQTRGVLAIALDARQAGPRLLAERARRLLEIQASAGSTPAEKLAVDAELLALAQIRYQQRFAEAERAVAAILGVTPRRKLDVLVGLLKAQAQHPFLPTPPTYVIDLIGWFSGYSPTSASRDRTSEALRVLGLSSSALEHELWEEIAQRHSVSTVKLLQYARAIGNPVYVITPQNRADFSKVKGLSIAAALSISDAFSKGRTVIIHQDPLVFDSRVAGRDLEWVGHGWISEDPETNAETGYLISGSARTPLATTTAASAPVTGGGASAFLRGLAELLRDKGKCILDPCACVGQPVNLASGNMYHQFADFSIPGRGLPLQLTRTYNAQSAVDGPFGYGWTHSYAARLSEQPSGDVTYIDGSGGEYTFTKSGAAYTAPPGLFLTLSKGSQFTLRDRYGTRWDFSLAGALTRIADRNGNAQTLSYSSSRLTRVTDALGRAITFSYNGSGKITSVRDFSGRTWSYTYSGSDLATSTTPSDAATPAYTTRYGYYTQAPWQHKLKTITDPRGAVIEFRYYADGRAFQTIEPEGKTLTFYYRPLQRATDVVTERGERWSFRFDERGAITRIVQPDGEPVIREWSAAGTLTRLVNQAGFASTFAYDARGNLTSFTDALGGRYTYSYDPSFSQITSFQDPLGNTSTLSIDPANGNALSTTDAGGNRTNFSYDAFGNLTALTDAANRTMSFSYDDNNYLAAVRNGRGNSWTITNDDLGRALSIRDPLANTTTQTHDLLGRLLNTRDGEGNLWRFSYDGAGNLTGVTDPAGRATTYAYDGLSNVISVRNALNQTIQLGYVTNSCIDCTSKPSNLVSLTDARGHTRRFSYDAMDRLIGTEDGVGRTRAFGYDARGLLVRVTDERGAEASARYDALGRLAEARYADGARDSFSYDAVGNLLTAANATTTISFSYDQLNRAVQVRDSALNKLVRYTYDSLGNRASLIAPDGRSQRYSYDAANNLTAITDLNGVATAMSYDAADRLTTMAPQAGQPGVRASYTYDRASRLTRLVNSSADGSTTFADMRITLDQLGNQTLLAVTGAAALTGLVGQSSFQYDQLDRLSSFTLPGAQATAATYDAGGNRNALAGAGAFHDEADRLTFGGPGGATSYLYDERGNLSATIGADGKQTSYSWNAKNQLVRITYPDGTSSAYSYDAFGRRASRTTRDGQTVRYLYDGMNILHEYTGAGALLATYVHGPGLDRPISMTRGGQTSYYMYDRLGSVIGLSDGAKALRASYVYDPWGNRIGGSDGAIANPYRYSGREYDAESGLYFMRARYYDPQAGRFISADPSGLSGGVNSYAYAANNPVNFTDRLGLSPNPQGVCKGLVNMLLGAFLIAGALALITPALSVLTGLLIAALITYGAFQITMGLIQTLDGASGGDASNIPDTLGQLLTPEGSAARDIVEVGESFLPSKSPKAIERLSDIQGKLADAIDKIEAAEGAIDAINDIGGGDGAQQPVGRPTLQGYVEKRVYPNGQEADQ